MSLKPGVRIWLPCEVKPGPFPDERIVRLNANDKEWLGFVDIHSLRDAVTEGSTHVRALVVEVQEHEFVARLPGHEFRVVSRLDLKGGTTWCPRRLMDSLWQALLIRAGAKAPNPASARP